MPAQVDPLFRKQAHFNQQGQFETIWDIPRAIQIKLVISRTPFTPYSSSYLRNMLFQEFKNIARISWRNVWPDSIWTTKLGGGIAFSTSGPRFHSKIDCAHETLWSARYLNQIESEAIQMKYMSSVYCRWGSRKGTCQRNFKKNSNFSWHSQQGSRQCTTTVYCLARTLV